MRKARLAKHRHRPRSSDARRQRLAIMNQQPRPEPQPMGLARVVELTRGHLELDVAFIAQLTDDGHVYAAIAGDGPGWPPAALVLPAWRADSQVEARQQMRKHQTGPPGKVGQVEQSA